LPGLYSIFEASLAIPVAPSQTKRAILDELAEPRVTVGAAHALYFFAADAGCLQAKLEMLAENTFYCLEFWSDKKLRLL
jgi:hypothetical protein